MWTLSGLNRRLKHLLFHTFLQQEVHFFEKNDAGEKNNLQRDDMLICHLFDSQASFIVEKNFEVKS